MNTVTNSYLDALPQASEGLIAKVSEAIEQIGVAGLDLDSLVEGFVWVERNDAWMGGFKVDVVAVIAGDHSSFVRLRCQFTPDANPTSVAAEFGEVTR